MNKDRRGRKTVRAAFARRLTSLALAAVMLWSLLPGLTPAAKAAEWMEPYLEQLVDWGVMQGNASGDLNPDRVLTRAEFVTMINRAFGYTELGTTPFRDVPENAWYADDINIAYQAGYFTGTSETTAGPMGRVTREQAAVLLGRNLRLQGIPGVNSDFSDVWQMGNWSRGMVQECAELGIIQGYADGSFRPKNYITRGQMACFLVRALGTLVHETGDQVVGGVYGNLTVNTAGVKLKDTVVTGNLYLSGGVGLGSVELENVTVMGRIVVCGSGEAERGENSIILRNVTAEAMEIDSLSDHFMTVRTEGLTNIANTIVRTSAYLEDVTDDDQGLRVITLDGTADGTQLQLAGNIKEVVNITPNSDLQVVQGVTGKLTVDERAAGSALSIANDTTVKILNLDAGIPVTGNGDVSKMNVNASGSSATMLPDTIYIRPGIDSNINNKVMDSIAAEESSDEPRLLAGYPLIRNLASTSADGVFSTNKRGTLYWAVSALLDGSAGEEELRSPSAYPGKILRSGTINVTASKTEMTARLTGLSREGSYYLSAMLVDERGHASPVKVTAFTTTDDTAPNFAAGYPEAVVYVSDEDEQFVQARVMATKTCRLYYALLPSSASAPTADDMRSGAVTGNLGYGSMEVRKNTAYTIPKVNSAYLQEKTTYALYLWLNDSDNGKSSAVRRLQVTTKDVTPPIIEGLEPTDMKATTITMTYSLNEPGTLYWVIVKKGEKFYSSDIEEVGTPPNQANNDIAKMQIKRGLGVKHGSSSTSRAETDTNFTITGLQSQTTYDLYYVAEDRDGNFNIYTTTLTPPMQVNTLDEEGPTVTQEFTHDGSDGNTQHPTPYADTSIRLVFSEEVQGIGSSSAQPPSRFLQFFENEETARLAQALEEHIKLYYNPAEGAGIGQEVQVTGEDREYGMIDYSKAEVTMDRDTGEMIITFPQDKGGLKLTSGARYYFELEGIYDTVTPKPNPMENTTRGKLKLPEFTTLFATVNLELMGSQNLTVDGLPVTADQTFRVTPVGTESVSEDTLWDMLIWSDSTISYTLYSRERARGEDGSWGAWGDWSLAGTPTGSTVNADVGGIEGGRVYASLNGYVKNDEGLTQELPALRELVNQTEYAITVVDNTHIDPNARNINMEIMVAAGGRNAIQTLAGRRDLGQDRDLAEAQGFGAELIHLPNPFKVPIPIRGKVPVFENGRPYISPGDTAATVTMQLDLPARVYYLAVPIDNPDEMTQMEITMANGEKRPVLWGANARAAITPKKAGDDGQDVDVDLREVYVDGSRTPVELTVPTRTDITTKRNYGVGASQGNSAEELGGPIPAHVSQPITIPNLIPETYYLLYLVTENYNTGDRSTKVVCYQFYTKTAELPIIQVSRSGSRATEISVGIKKSAILEYNLIPTSVLTRSTSPFAEAFAAGTTANSNYTGISGVTNVLDAMLNDYNGNGSVFDNFATPETKLRFGTLIRSLQGSGQDAPIQVSPSGGERYVNDGSADWVRQSIDLSRYLNDPNNQNYYTLLVVGHSLNSDVSNDAFRASQPYFYENTQKLKATGYATPDEENKEYFTGTLRVEFSDNLNFRVRDPNVGKDITYALDSCSLNDGRHTGTDNASGNYKNIGSVMSSRTITGKGTGAASLELTKRTYHGTNIGDTLYFDANNLAPGSYIAFDSGLCGSNRQVREGTSLTATLRRRSINTGTEQAPVWAYEWYLELSPEEWLTN